MYIGGSKEGGEGMYICGIVEDGGARYMWVS